MEGRKEGRKEGMDYGRAARSDGCSGNTVEKLKIKMRGERKERKRRGERQTERQRPAIAELFLW